jgi:hemoglobin-like flavoprotein
VQEADQAQNLISNLVNAAANVANNPLLDANKNQANLQLQSIKIQSEQAKLVSETLAQSLQTNQFLQYSNLNLANISQQMEEANRARRVDTSTEAARLLRTTSQIDLFGRDINN